MSSKKFARAADLVKAVLERYGIDEVQGMLFTLWETESGMFNKHTEVVGFARGILRVRVDSPGCMQELRMAKRGLLKSINKYFKAEKVKDITFIAAL